jgi:formylglycine-generating enzyme required for sulfatase activity
MNDAYCRLVGALQDGEILHRFPSLADALWLACQRPVESEVTEKRRVETQKHAERVGDAATATPARELPSEPALRAPDVIAEPPPLAIKPLHITIDTAEPDELRAVVPSEEGKGHAPRGPSIEVPSLPSLPNRDRFVRQLKLLRRLHPSLRRRTLNLDATVRRFCEEEIPEPVFSPGYEQTLNLTFLVDESPTMDMWRNMASEFFGVLQASAAFQRSRAFLWSVTMQDGRAQASYSPLHSAADESESDADVVKRLEFSAHDVVVLFSDCTARRWYRSDCMAQWKEWARRAHVVVVNPLPQRFWPRTSLEAAQRVNLRMDQVASPNASLRVSSPQQTGPDLPRDQTFALPIVAPDPAHLLAWSRFMALRRRSFPGRLYSIGDSQPLSPAPERKPLTSRERLAMFKRQARPEAVELARLVAASPIINLPIVRLLRSRLLAPSRPGVDPNDCSYDAEVMLSPLLQVAPIDKREKRSAEPDQVLYRFPDEKGGQDIKGMRAALVGELPRARIQEVLNTIGFYIEHEAEELQAGHFHGFVAMLHNPEQAVGDELWRVHEIVQIAARIIFRRLGGKYAELLKSAGQPRFLSELNAAFTQAQTACEAGDAPKAQQILKAARQAAEKSDWADAHCLLDEQLDFYGGLLQVEQLLHQELTKRGPFTEPTTGMVLAPIPAGTFLMGSPESEKGRYEDEGPQHRVTLSNDFWIGIHPVTQQQYEAVMGDNPSKFKGPDRPVEQVSWEDAVAFCERLNKQTSDLPEGNEFRLPTEAEWEYCCRAGLTTRFCFGDDEELLGEYAWYGTNSEQETHPVGKKRANEWGLHDMHGNVWEWCLDAVERLKAARTYVDGVVDPASIKGGRRVLRGGSWFVGGRGCRSAFRFADEPGFRIVNLGFRVCLAPSPGAGTSGSEATREALRKLRVWCTDERFGDPGSSIPQDIFSSSQYGPVGVSQIEQQVMMDKGWVEEIGLDVRITEEGRRAASGSDTT